VPVTVSGVGTIAGLTLSLDGTTCNTTIGSTTVGVDHTWVGDLVFNLTSPGGTTVTLMSRPGGTGNSANNFCQTVLTDAAASPIRAPSSRPLRWGPSPGRTGTAPGCSTSRTSSPPTPGTCGRSRSTPPPSAALPERRRGVLAAVAWPDPGSWRRSTARPSTS
jgi:hypothetical protein